MAIETELAAPVFLVAVPQMADPNFSRGVVFILEHDENGSMGLVINKTGELDISSFCSSQEMEYRGGDPSASIFKGGPVQPERAFILHTSDHEGPETEHIIDGLRLSYSLESLKLIAEKPPPELRIYLGYAGWGPGQLAKEIQAGAWLVAPAEPELVYHHKPETVWEKTLLRMGIEPARLMHSGMVH
ncbi:MAG: YqgE/AlgH family protein [Myxococcota bacterium]